MFVPIEQQSYNAGFVAGAASAPKKSKAGWIVLAIFLVCSLIGFVVTVNSCSAAAASIGNLGMTDSAPMTFDDTVAVINMSGTIQYDGTSCSPEGLRYLLQQAEADPNIRAVVIRVDSGGGTATAGEEMSNLVADFSKPVVISSASMNCSAAYMISSQADYIFVNRSTAIGSIGTAMQLMDLSGLYGLLGINITNVTSADSKDSSYGTRPLTDDELAYYQDLVNSCNQVFIDMVARGRGMTEDQVRQLATGLYWMGEEAVSLGVADQVGTYDDALDKAAELGGLSGSYDVVTLTVDSYGMDLYSLLGLSAGGEGSSSQSDVALQATAQLPGQVTQAA